MAAAGQYGAGVLPCPFVQEESGHVLGLRCLQCWPCCDAGRLRGEADHERLELGGNLLLPLQGAGLHTSGRGCI